MSKEDCVDVAVLIGRFQPFHSGHAKLLQRALELASRVVVVLGSSFHARSAKNPLTAAERETMIRATLPEAIQQRLYCVPVRDYYDDQRWAATVRDAVSRFSKEGERVALIGHVKDASSYYLNLFPAWRLVEAESQGHIDATSIRRALFEAEDVSVALTSIAETMPQAVRDYLTAWSVSPTYQALVDEHRQILRYRQAWSNAPYPPIFSTVDAVVRAADHVLLIQRGGFPGKGQWALPGGFVDQRERLLQAAIRELEEETRLGVTRAALQDALLSVKVFDHPDRSQRGRTITHAHFFDLKVEHLPEITAADDAASATWVPIAALAGMEEQFYEDHFHILDTFLNLTDSGLVG